MELVRKHFINKYTYVNKSSLDSSCLKHEFLRWKSVRTGLRTLSIKGQNASPGLTFIADPPKPLPITRPFYLCVPLHESYPYKHCRLMKRCTYTKSEHFSQEVSTFWLSPWGDSRYPAQCCSMSEAWRWA